MDHGGPNRRSLACLVQPDWTVEHNFHSSSLTNFEIAIPRQNGDCDSRRDSETQADFGSCVFIMAQCPRNSTPYESGQQSRTDCDEGMAISV